MSRRTETNEQVEETNSENRQVYGRGNGADQAVGGPDGTSQDSLEAVIRLAMNGGMEEFLGNVRYVDPETGLAMKEAVMRCGNIMQSVQNELHRIGVNFNQAVKLENIRRMEQALDREWKHGSVDTRLGVAEKRQALAKEKEDIESGAGALSKEELDSLLRRYEDATKEVSKILWHTQE